MTARSDEIGVEHLPAAIQALAADPAAVAAGAAIVEQSPSNGNGRANGRARSRRAGVDRDQIEHASRGAVPTSIPGACSGSLLRSRRDAMGITYVTGAVRRSDRPDEKRLPVRFLVDTGAVYTVLPRSVWSALDLIPERTVDFTLADGSVIARGVSECRIDIAGHSATSPVVLGESDEGPLLGAVTLETLGLMVNPLSRRLVPLRLVLAAVDAPGP